MRIVLAGAALLLAAIASGTAAESTPPPWRSTCDVKPWADRTLDDNSTRDEIVESRRLLMDNIAAADGYVVCLNTALETLKARFAASGRSVNPIVERAVAAATDFATRVKLDYVTSFNAAVDTYNRYRSSGAGGKVAPLDESLARPPSPDARMVLPPDAGLLSMQARLIDVPPDCDDYFPRWVKIHHRGGTTTIGYEVAPDGSVANAQVLQSSDNPDIDNAALTCVSDGWHYAPAIHDGVPVAATGFFATISFATSHRVGL
ncbi:MAG TPA: energy transducer TonB [Rhizomicrobium sp.]|nr:energy transducer TonB [Rhizomicrobium sp.]